MIDKVNSTYNPIEINAGPGTKGIFIDQGVIKYHNPLSGGFYGKLYYISGRSMSLLSKIWTIADFETKPVTRLSFMDQLSRFSTNQKSFKRQLGVLILNWW